MRGEAAVILLSLACASGFIIIPEELPTILSVIYSNIPPIKLGFDTRLGFGFRIGPHTDFQTLIEIGPQQNTNPIGMGNETLAKRQSLARKRFKPKKLEKKSVTENNPQAELEGSQRVQQILKDIFHGRLGRISYSNINEIQFKKVPGIDETNSEQEKPSKVKNSESPTKIVLLK